MSIEHAAKFAIIDKLMRKNGISEEIKRLAKQDPAKVIALIPEIVRRVSRYPQSDRLGNAIFNLKKIEKSLSQSGNVNPKLRQVLSSSIRHLSGRARTDTERRMAVFRTAFPNNLAAVRDFTERLANSSNKLEKAFQNLVIGNSDTGQAMNLYSEFEKGTLCAASVSTSPDAYPPRLRLVLSILDYFLRCPDKVEFSSPNSSYTYAQMMAGEYKISVTSNGLDFMSEDENSEVEIMVWPPGSNERGIQYFRLCLDYSRKLKVWCWSGRAETENFAEAFVSEMLAGCNKELDPVKLWDAGATYLLNKLYVYLLAQNSDTSTDGQSGNNWRNLILPRKTS
jgi:hypothetical protein